LFVVVVVVDCRKKKKTLTFIFEDVIMASFDQQRPVCAKLTDFGASAVFGLRRKSLSKDVGTVRYAAPELLDGRPYDGKVDVYAYAMLLWEMVTSRYPFADCEFGVQVEKRVCAGGRPDLPRDCPGPPAFQALIRQCWSQDPVERPKFDEVRLALFRMIRAEWRLGDSEALYIDETERALAPVAVAASSGSGTSSPVAGSPSSSTSVLAASRELGRRIGKKKKKAISMLALGASTSGSTSDSDGSESAGMPRRYRCANSTVFAEPPIFVEQAGGSAHSAPLEASHGADATERLVRTERPRALGESLSSDSTAMDSSDSMITPRACANDSQAKRDVNDNGNNDDGGDSDDDEHDQLLQVIVASLNAKLEEERQLRQELVQLKQRLVRIRQSKERVQ
jgi:serine/threonine protein kinase